jgi:UPF0716 protein FxsA
MIRNWPLLFIVIPLIELYFIIAVGEQIGAFWTIILVLLTAVVGVNLLRFQGMSTLARAQKNMAQGQIPAMEMAEGIALAVAGVLLITPGFITDSIGLLLLIPASRQYIVRMMMAKATVKTNFHGGMGGFQQGQPQNQQDVYGKKPETDKPKVGRTIEGEYKRED